MAAPYQSTTSLWLTVARTAAVVVASAAEISTCAGGLEQATARHRRNRWWLTLNRPAPWPGPANKPAGSFVMWVSRLGKRLAR